MKILIDLSSLKTRLLRMHYQRLVAVDFRDIVEIFFIEPKIDYPYRYGPVDVLMEYINTITPTDYMEQNNKALDTAISQFSLDLEELVNYHFGDQTQTVEFERMLDDSALFTTKPSGCHIP